MRVTVPSDAAGPRLVTIRTAARPFGAADSSDLALHLASIRNSSGEEYISGWAAEANVIGSDEILTTEVEPGDYYLAVTDGAGVATRYALCLALGNDCALPDLPPASAVTSQGTRSANLGD
jgi:hypothetical protein